jgi:hypothetical protein
MRHLNRELSPHILTSSLPEIPITDRFTRWSCRRDTWLDSRCCIPCCISISSICTRYYCISFFGGFRGERGDDPRERPLPPFQLTHLLASLHYHHHHHPHVPHVYLSRFYIPLQPPPFFAFFIVNYVFCTHPRDTALPLCRYRSQQQ